jgi:hypothetical protein
MARRTLDVAVFQSQACNSASAPSAGVLGSLTARAAYRWSPDRPMPCGASALPPLKCRGEPSVAD